MKRVCIVALNGGVAASIAGPADFFQLAGVLWNAIVGQAVEPRYEVVVASWDGRPVKCRGGQTVVAQQALQDVSDSDLIVITALSTGIDKVLGQNSGLLPWLQECYRAGAELASICTGAFVLGESGLLDGRTATTHWGYARSFQSRYPRVKLQPEKMVTDSEGLYCSGGAGAYQELCLYLEEKYHGRRAALECARAMVYDPGRVSQQPYAALLTPDDDHDPEIARMCAWMQENYQYPVSMPALAGQWGMSLRTMERRFKAGTGQSPLAFLQNIRVEAAKRLLEEGGLGFEDITSRVGYEDYSAFRRLFTKYAGLSPAEYQRMYGGRG